MEKAKDRNALIGERVRFYRTTRSMSMDTLAKAVPFKLSAQQISLYEKGECRWPADLLCAVAVVLRIDLRTLAGMEDTVRTGRKDVPDFEAEKYKATILRMRPKVRDAIYRVIDVFIEMTE